MKTPTAPIASPTTTAATSPKRPVKTFRLGPIKAAVWANEADQKTFYNVAITRTYQDEQKQFHDTNSFGRDDLPLVATVADQAHTFIFEQLAAPKSDSRE
jgi:hypothetical protein